MATGSPPGVSDVAASHLCCESFFIHYIEAELNQWNSFDCNYVFPIKYPDSSVPGCG